MNTTKVIWQGNLYRLVKLQKVIAGAVIDERPSLQTKLGLNWIEEKIACKEFCKEIVTFLEDLK